ncbi:MAG TPA: N-formylglutamate amidohydrolase [Stellaceae bacterium]|nr:N-formylglutamate amidohydrolase [Stellaceae bacterium]
MDDGIGIAVEEGEGCIAPPSVIQVNSPLLQTLPLVVASPHSGRTYPRDFVAASRLDPLALRKSEDSFVDEIFAAAPSLGAPLLRALFPRAYVDPNREPYELDPLMFEDALPDWVNSLSPRVAVGLGTIARVVADGENIYCRKLRFAEAEGRIERLYRPYHQALRQLLDATQQRFGCYILLDAHSMPSIGGRDGSRRRVDIVLGDRHGTSCSPVLTDAAERLLTAKGYLVARNIPYAGGFTTRHYGNPDAAGHSLQIEINRSLYMDERTLDRKPHLAEIAADMADLVTVLGSVDADLLKSGKGLKSDPGA